MKELEAQIGNFDKDRKAHDDERNRLAKENEEYRIQLKVREGLEKGTKVDVSSENPRIA